MLQRKKRKEQREESESKKSIIEKRHEFVVPCIVEHFSISKYRFDSDRAIWSASFSSMPST